MKIDRVEAFYLRAPLGRRFAWSKAWTDARSSTLVKITADDGTEGWGEAGVLATPALSSVIEWLIAPLLIGRDVLDRQGLADDIGEALKVAGQRGLLLQALSGVDIAIWDLVGKALGQPIHCLLGGNAAAEVPAYATGLYYDQIERPSELLDSRLDEVERYLDAGFAGIKMKIGGLSERDDLHQVERIRDTIGDRGLLMVDANQAYDRITAKRVGRALDALDIFWFEEPLPNEDVVGLRELRQAVDVPIAGGELDSSRSAFLRILEARALDIIQPDICMVGGFSELQRICQLADVWHVRCLPHVWGSAVAFTAALHFVSVLPCGRSISTPAPIIQLPALEYDQTPNPLREEISPNRPQLKDGWVPVPRGPGLGIDIDPAAIAAYHVQ